MKPPAAPPHIGLFDSGIGGLSVLRALRRQLPAARYSYIADTAYTPWGERPAGWVVARCEQLSASLIEPPGGTAVDLVLVACNTGTTQAIAALRARWPRVAFVGVEPGIKPAVAASPKRRVAVMATTSTLASPRLRQLVDHHGGAAWWLHLPCPGLVEAIERASGGGDAQGRQAADVRAAQAADAQAADVSLAAQLDTIAATLRGAEVDTVVLACTHYPLVADALQQRLGPAVLLIDTAEAVVRRVISLLANGRPGCAGGAGRSGDTGASGDLDDGVDTDTDTAITTVGVVTGPLRLLATGETRALQGAAQRWLGVGQQVERLALPPPEWPLRP
jgi:glutamate racemase